MITQLKQAALSFLAIFAAYWLYVLIAVPFIDPPVRRRVSAPVGDIEEVTANSRRQQLAQLAPLLPPDAWELDDPKIIETEQGLLLFKDYQTLPDGKLAMKPCTVVFFSAGNRRGAAERPGRPILLSAPSGATLQFDGQSDTLKAEFGKLKGGHLHGEIRIFGPETSPGAQNQLEVLTREVLIDEQKITTLHDVDFRFGQSYGSGRDLVIDLTPPPTKGSAPPKMGLSIGGMKKLELRTVYKFHLHTPAKANREEGVPPADGTFNGNAIVNGAAPAARASRALFSNEGETNLEITCKGRFVYDFDEPSASFDDQVDVVRLADNGPSDQLNCRLLTIFFSRPPQTTRNGNANETDADAPTPSPSSSIERIVAEGEPAILRAPSVNANARGDRLEYNLVTRQVQIGFKSDQSGLLKRRGNQTGFVQHGLNQIEAPWIMYQIPEDSGRLGRVWADGPGVLRGTFGQEPAQPLETTWGDKLYVRPHEGNQVVTLTGNAAIRYAENQRFASQELHLWLYEIPDPSRPPPTADDPPQKFVLIPDRILAQDNVQLDSPRFSGHLQRVEAFFDYSQRGRLPIGGPAKNVSNTSRPSVGTPGTSADPNGTGAATSPQKLDVSGQIARLMLRKVGNETVLEAVTVEGGVAVADAASLAAGLFPQLKITGDSLTVLDASQERARVRVNGTADRPANVLARGMTMTGPAIQLSQVDNRLWIDGPGRMTLPPAPPKPVAEGQILYQDERAKVAPPPQEPMVVDWQRGMIFDGQTAHFEQNVETRGKQWNAQGELVDVYARGNSLDVGLNQFVNFAQPPQERDVGISRLTYGGAVLVTTRTFKERAQIAFEQMQINNMVLEQEPNSHEPNRIRGDGPGWLSSVRFGTVTTTTPAAANARPNPNVAPPRTGLTYVYVEFARGLEGNVAAKQVTFFENVKAVHGPVNAWEEQLRPDPQFLGTDGVFVTCGRLSLAEMPSFIPGQPSMELDAVGNATAEGRQFAARGGRISYSQSKDMLTLEGDARSEAELWRLPRTESVKPDAIARKIMYWKNDNRIEVVSAREIDLTRFNNQPPR